MVHKTLPTPYFAMEQLKIPFCKLTSWSGWILPVNHSEIKNTTFRCIELTQKLLFTEKAVKQRQEITFHVWYSTEL